MAKMYRIKSLTERSRKRYVYGGLNTPSWCDRGREYPPGEALLMMVRLREHAPNHEWVLEPVDE